MGIAAVSRRGPADLHPLVSLLLLGHPLRPLGPSALSAHTDREQLPWGERQEESREI